MIWGHHTLIWPPGTGLVSLIAPPFGQLVSHTYAHAVIEFFIAGTVCVITHKCTIHRIRERAYGLTKSMK